MKVNFFLVLTLILLLIPIVHSQGFQFQPYWLYNALNALFKPQVPYSSLRDVIFFAIVPFLATFTICFGILTQLGILKKKNVNVVISLLFALSLMYYGILSHIVSIVMSFGSFVVVIIFGAIFVVGTFLFGKAKTGGWKSKADAYGATSKQMETLKKELQNVHEELTIIREDLSEQYISPSELKKLKNREETLQKRATDLRKEISELMSKSEILRDETIFGEEG